MRNCISLVFSGLSAAKISLAARMPFSNCDTKKDSNWRAAASSAAPRSLRPSAVIECSPARSVHAAGAPAAFMG